MSVCLFTLVFSPAFDQGSQDMERKDATKILQSLADGVDPTTGEPFPASSPYQRADVVRALFAAVRALGSVGTVTAPAHEQSVGDQPGSQSSPSDSEKPKASKPKVDPKPKIEKPGLANAGRPWSQEEDARLGRAFDDGISIEMLAQEHKRSRFAIEARLVKLGRIAEPSVALRFPMKKSTAAEPASLYPV